MKTILVYLSAIFLSNIITGEKHKMRDYIIAVLIAIATTFLTAPMFAMDLDYSEYSHTKTNIYFDGEAKVFMNGGNMSYHLF